MVTGRIETALVRPARRIARHQKVERLMLRSSFWVMHKSTIVMILERIVSLLQENQKVLIAICLARIGASKPSIGGHLLLQG